MELENNIQEKIKQIKLPFDNDYYEKCSADGYAFLAYAYSKLGLEYELLFNKVLENNLTLNAERVIILQKYSMSNQSVFKETQYIYTLWTCFEFFYKIKNHEIMNDINEKINKIGFYENGFARYCDTEINYLVPNVTSAYAVIKSYLNEKEGVEKIINLLRINQKNGNWQYKVRKDDNFYNTNKFEDSFHLAMMVYHLRKIEKNLNIKTDDIYLSSIETLYNMNKINLQEGSMGWGVPMLLLASKDINNELYNRCFDVIDKYLNHKNFRVRAITAFCLTMEY